MRRVRFFAAAIVLVGLSRIAGASTWQIDTAHSSAQFAVRHMMVSTVRGTLGKITGAVNLDEAELTKSAVEATVDATTIDTREPKRDAHLKSPDFFDVAQYPTITFKSKKVAKLGDAKFQVTGDLTMHGVTKEVVLDVEGVPRPFKDPMGNLRLCGIATTKLNRKDFGVQWNKTLDGGGLMVGDDVDVTIDLELTAKP